MNAVDIILIIIVAAVIFFAVRTMVRSKHCQGNCSCCSGCSDCRKKTMPEKAENINERSAKDEI